MVDQRPTEPAAAERRKSKRFTLQAPVTVSIGAQTYPAFTRDLSAEAFYFHLGSKQKLCAGENVQFVIEMPPAIAASGPCRIQGQGEAIRIEETAWNETGVAVRIQQYKILSGSN